jgi:hypothetical protein
MEVHSHAHTERKKWTHYLWEFLMLFLAVFCGFLAENQREHMVEHRREKQFMRSMIEDLKADTAEMKDILSNVYISSNNVDSMLLLLTADIITDEAIIKSYQFTFPALNNIVVVFNDRTITQLKNAGNMRLIRNQKVNDDIIKYWNHIEQINKTLDRHLSYRTKGRDMETRIFNTAEIFLKNDRHIAKPKESVHLISKEQSTIKEYANVIAYCGVMLSAVDNLVKEQNKLAIELIELIKKEYHLK